MSTLLVRGGWVGGSYSDIKTNLSQVGLDWDWPTGLSLAKKYFVTKKKLVQKKNFGLELLFR